MYPQTQAHAARLCQETFLTGFAFHPLRRHSRSSAGPDELGCVPLIHLGVLSIAQTSAPEEAWCTPKSDHVSCYFPYGQGLSPVILLGSPPKKSHLGDLRLSPVSARTVSALVHQLHQPTHIPVGAMAWPVLPLASYISCKVTGIVP